MAAIGRAGTSRRLRALASAASLLALAVACMTPRDESLGPRQEGSASGKPSEEGSAEADFRRALEIVDSDPAGALELLEGALTRWPAEDLEGRHQVRVWLVHACALARELERGLAHAEAAIGARPEDPWLRYAKGAALSEMGRYDEALRAFTEALESDPRHVKSLQHRASVAALIGRRESALADLDRALTILATSDPQSVPEGKDRMLSKLRLQRADVLDELGRHAEARAERERAEALLR